MVKITPKRALSVAILSAIGVLLLACCMCTAFSLSLKKGWNLVSIPTTLSSSQINDVLGSVEGNYVKVICYNSSDSKFYLYDPNDTMHSNLFSLNNSMGFWILMNESAVLDMEGHLLDSLTIPLEEGWNLIGVADSENVTLEEFLSSINDSLEMAFHYNNSWSSYIRGIDKPEQDYIWMGDALWVKVKGKALLHIKNGPEIDSITIAPDESAEAGVQINPAAGESKEVFVSAQVSHSKNINHIVSVVMDTPKGEFPMQLAEIVDMDTAIYNASFEMDYSDLPLLYNVTVIATDKKGKKGTGTGQFEYLSLVSLTLDATTISYGQTNIQETAYVDGDLDMQTTDKATVQNTGNVAINAIVNGTDMTGESDSIPVDAVGYRFGSDDYGDLSHEPVVEAINLQPADTLNLDLSLTVPAGILPGSYSGSLFINGAQP